jgi:RNA polymerase sigma factor (sigma-70 family)
MSELLLSYLNGNPVAGEKLMKLSLAFIKEKIYANKINCKDQKDELVMEVIMKLLTKIDTFVPNHKALDLGYWPWLSTICYNTYMDYCRKKSKDSLFLSIDDRYDEGDFKFEIIAEESTNKKEIINKLMELAKNLPPRQNLIINLKYKFGMSYSEIANYLDETVNSVTVAHHRAICKLRENFINDGGNPNCVFAA